MSITGLEWYYFYGYGHGYHTLEVNMPPDSMAAQIWLTGTSGDGTGATFFVGIKHYRQRLSSGEDIDHDFGPWLDWPPVVFDFISSVTFGLVTDDDQECWAMARLDHWE